MNQTEDNIDTGSMPLLSNESLVYIGKIPLSKSFYSISSIVGQWMHLPVLLVEVYACGHSKILRTAPVIHLISIIMYRMSRRMS